MAGPLSAGATTSNVRPVAEPIGGPSGATRISAMTILTVWHDGGCPLCRREIAMLRPFGLAARSPVVLAMLERLYVRFLLVRPRLRRLAGGGASA